MAALGSPGTAALFGRDTMGVARRWPWARGSLVALPRACYALTVTSARRLHFSYEDYLQALRVSELKLEYCDGVIYAMAGGTIAHAQLSARMIRFLGNAVQAPCEVFSSDLKVRVEATDLSAFPDASVVCGEVEAPAVDAHAVSNPSLLLQVTSRSTEDYDRGDKLSHYKQLPSLMAVVFVSHRHRRVTVVSRVDAGWEEHDYRGGERVVIPTPACTVDVDALYEGIALD